KSELSSVISQSGNPAPEQITVVTVKKITDLPPQRSRYFHRSTDNALGFRLFESAPASMLAVPPIIILFPQAVAALGHQPLFVRIVAEPLRFVPRFGYCARCFRAKTIVVPQLPIFPVGMDNVEDRHLDGAHPFTTMAETSQTLKAVMKAIAILHDKVITHLTGVFLAPGKLAILDSETLGIFRESVLNDPFIERGWQVQHVGKVYGYLLVWKSLCPFSCVLGIDLQEL